MSSLGSSSEPGWPPELVGSSLLARRARDDVQRAAAARRALVVAESGLDGEAVARTIHRCGSSDAAPFVAVDCGGGDPKSIELVLFGTELGGRASRADGPAVVRPGARLLASAGGTLYLANIAELPAAAQEHLARFVRDGEVRVGRAGRQVRLDVRVIAGCPESLEPEVSRGGFRADLYRRLTAVRVDVPPLRLRPDDIAAVARAVIAEVAARGGGVPRSFTEAALALVAALPWPGNVRELRDVLERAVAAAPPGPVRVEDLLGQLGSGWRRARATDRSLREARHQFEREYIAAVLRDHGWRMSEAARTLGMQRPNLYRKVRQLDIPAPRVRAR